MTRILGYISAIALALVLSGCGIALTSADLPHKTTGSTTTVASASPSASPKPKPVNGTCKKASSEMLEYLESVGNAGGDITFPRGAIIQEDETWWEAAVAVHYDDKSKYSSTPSVRYFRTNAPGNPEAVHGFEVGYSLRAEKCLKR